MILYMPIHYGYNGNNNWQSPYQRILGIFSSLDLAQTSCQVNAGKQLVWQDNIAGKIRDNWYQIHEYKLDDKKINL